MAEILEPVTDVTTLATLDALAARHRAASGAGMQILTYLGGSAETLLGKLPPPVRGGLEDATVRAMEIAFSAAERSRGVIDDRPDWMNRALATAMGAAGGFGGLPGALAELPLTVTVLMRAIQGIAIEYGFDPASDDVRLEVLRVFASAGPLEHDDGTDMAFMTARVTLTGASLNALIARVAPKLAASMGQKLAAQAVPVLGAVAGAAINYAFTGYYQEIAHVHFGLKRLAQDSGADEGLLREELRTRIEGSAR